MKIKISSYKILTLCLGLILTSSFTFSQSVSGKIVDESGNGIANALVRHESNSNVFTKTATDGNYTIPGNVGTKLRVGALHFETMKGVTVTSSNGFNVTMQEDVLEASGDEYRITFDHTRPGDKYSLDELKEDFNIAYGKGFYDGDEASNRASIDPNESIDEGGSSLKIKYPKGKVGTSNSGVDTRVYLSRDFKTGRSYTGDDLYISYWLKFDNGTNYRCGGKLPSLGGEFYNPVEDKNQRFKGRIMWRKGGSVNMYMELPHDQPSVADVDRMMGENMGGDGCIPGDLWTSYFSDGKWHNVELHYVMEKNGNPGYFECWIDGGIGYKFLDSDKFGKYRQGWPGMQDLTSNFIMISTFYGGSNVSRDAPLKDEFIWFDEFRVSKSRIDEYAKYRGETITSVNSTEELSKNLVFPNPSESGVFNLSTVTSYQVYDLNGNLIDEGKSDKIDLSGQSKGVYVLQAEGTRIKIVK